MGFGLRLLRLLAAVGGAVFVFVEFGIAAEAVVALALVLANLVIRRRLRAH